MQILFENLDKYAQLIGEGKFSLTVVIWTIIFLLMIQSVRYVSWVHAEKVAYRNRMPKGLQQNISIVISVEFIVSIVVTFILISLFRSPSFVWNCIVSQLIGILVGIASNLFIVSKYTALLNKSAVKSGIQKESKSPSPAPSQPVSTTIINIDADGKNDEHKSPYEEPNHPDDHLVEILNRLKNRRKWDAMDDDATSERMVEDMNAYSEGLTSTIEAVQDINSTLHKFESVLDGIVAQLAGVTQSMSDFREETREDQAIQSRVRILRFNIDLVAAKRSGERLPKDIFDQTLIDMDNYDKYCSAHPGFRNKITEAAERHILAEYDRCLKEDDFLQY